MFALVRQAIGRRRPPISSVLLQPLRSYGSKKPKTEGIVRLDAQFKTFKPVTPSLRFARMPRRDHLFKGGPVRILTVAKRKQGGRNHHGRITVRHRGGGHKRRIRIIDWHRREPGMHKVLRIEYDPNRSAHIALLRNTGTRRLSYIVAPDELKPEDQVESFMSLVDEKSVQSSDGITRSFPTSVGNCLPLKFIPVGSKVHCVGLHKFGRAQLCRSAGTSAQILYTALTGYAQLRLASGEVRRVPVDVCATIGQVSNPNHQHRILGKAGVRRWMGWRPTVRGVAMNSVDHPHGGGRGKSKGNKHPRSPWGVLAKGGRTRKHRNPLVIKPRNRR